MEESWNTMCVCVCIHIQQEHVNFPDDQKKLLFRKN